MKNKSIHQIMHTMDRGELNDFIKHYSRYDSKLKLALKTRACYLLKSDQKESSYSEIAQSLMKFSITKSISKEKENFLSLIYEDLYGQVIDFHSQKFYKDCASFYAAFLPHFIQVDRKNISENLRNKLNVVLDQLEIIILSDVPVDILKKLNAVLESNLFDNLNFTFSKFEYFFRLKKAIHVKLNTSKQFKKFVSELAIDQLDELSKDNIKTIFSEYFILNQTLPNNSLLDIQMFESILDIIEMSELKLAYKWIEYVSNNFELSDANYTLYLLRLSVRHSDLFNIPIYFLDLLFEDPNLKHIEYFESLVEEEYFSPIYDDVLNRLSNKALDRRHDIVLLKLYERLNLLDDFVLHFTKYNRIELLPDIDPLFLAENYAAFKPTYEMVLFTYLKSHFGPVSKKTIQSLIIFFLQNNLTGYSKILKMSIKKMERPELLTLNFID